ncbi:ABC transporter permease [Hydrogenibacillus schlegelii]|uniref:ABC transporter permease n=1 Tax=Hydrogenibacillus schlegelii TaxID=1484 RepID=A0A132N904_HYDSH|nr:ABC transporter permease [Hydrogenibacillus schlegelii]KWX06645.1 sugar ABC transporter permease [Hydrogenibacillus schlegelii]MBT9281247.1 ABC transporter permease [Hydrogenibacillus schlegelii]OAR03543.1 sugar ABC transporter permease [Hydrogenibacillus schlegelii]PTQ54267.1 MAG: Ribose ABC transport system, permease protein RbsC [Hydrogenibacillus schlegelii]
MKRGTGFSWGAFFGRWGVLIAIGLITVVFAALLPTFLSPSNVVSILRSISIVTVIAIGLTIALAVNGLDLSIGSTATLASALVVSFFVWYSLPFSISLALALILSLSVALVNILLIVKFRIPDLVATLSTMFIVEGIAMTYTGGGSISEGMPRLDGTPTDGTIPPLFKALGQVPAIIVIMLVAVALVHIFLNHTRYGRLMYATGGNLEAARLAGIPVDRYRALAYVLSALFAAVGGILIASRIGSAQVNAGAGYLMPAVAAAFIGFSFAGQGKPNAIGTFAGAVLIGVLENGLVMMSVPYYSMNIVKGTILALALASTYWHKKH